MEFYKKVLVLKEVCEGYSINGKQVCGILRAEEENGVLSVYLSLVNFSGVVGGTFYLIMQDGTGKFFWFDIGNRPLSLHLSPLNFATILKGFSCGVAYIKDDVPTLVAFASTENGNAISSFKKTLIDRCLENRKIKKKIELPPQNKPLPYEKVEEESPLKTRKGCDKEEIGVKNDTRTVTDKYNDEAVATENYYPEEEIREKLKRIEELSDGFIQNEGGQTYAERRQGTQETRENFACNEDEKDDENGREYSEDFPYYDQVKDDLDGLFFKFEKELALCQTVPDSKWVKIYYSEGKYYVVGVVLKSQKARYICYGVPAEYSTEPPKELKGFCSFVPTSVFRLKGKGYWMMFQDAITGKCIKMDG